MEGAPEECMQPGQFYDDDHHDAYVHEDGDDMEVIDDIMGGDEPPSDEDEDGDDFMNGGANTGNPETDFQQNAEEMFIADQCESGEPEIKVLREDALDVMCAHSAPVFEMTALQGGGRSPLYFATGSGDDTAIIWRQSKTYEVGALTSSSDSDNNVRWKGQILNGQHSDTVASIAFNSDGTKLATGGLDGKVVIWDGESGNYIRTLDGVGGAIEWLTWHPRGPVVLAGSEDFTTWMWNADTGSCMQVFSGHRAEVNCGCFTPNGKLVVTAGMDASLRVWSPREGTAVVVIEGYPFHSRAITALDCHSDSTILLTGGEDGKVYLSSATTGKVLCDLNQESVRHADTVESVAFSQGYHQWFATAGLDGKVILWDINSQKHRICLNHKDGVTAIAWHPSTPLIATAGLDSIVRVWDARTASCVQEFHGHRKSLHDIKFSDNGLGFDAETTASLIVSCSEDRSVRAFALHNCFS